MTLSLDDAPKIASYAIPPPTTDPAKTAVSQAIELSQAIHRINLVNAWALALSAGTRVLELGCGQGTCTQVLAHAVSQGASGGHVDAVDPAPLDYGSPFTLAQAQDHLSAGELGRSITWHQADPLGFLTAAAETGTTWDVAVLAHCIWYFASPDELVRMLTALKGRATRVCVAEYALHASEARAAPHVLAALARGMVEAHRDSSENIRTPLSPEGIRRAATVAGWRVESETVVAPAKELADGRWETGSVVSKEFLQDVDEVRDERVKAMLGSARDATVAAVEAVGGLKEVRTMDVWAATLVLDSRT